MVDFLKAPKRCLDLGSARPRCVACDGHGAWPWPGVLLSFAMLLACSAAGYGQVSWLFSPYRVQVLVDVELSTPMTKEEFAQLQSQIGTRLRALVGNRWEVKVVGFSHEHPACSIELANPPSREQLPADWKKAAQWDKIVVVHALRNGAGWSINVREFDVRLEQWGPLVILPIPGVGGLCDGVAEAIFRAHVPIGELQITDEQTVRVALRGSLLGGSEGDPGASVMPRLFLAAARYEDREGNARAIIPLPWTILKPLAADEDHAPSGITCQVISGLRNPLAARRRGRVKIYAWAAQPAVGTPARLRLRSREENQKPLVGHEIYVQASGDGPTVFVGRTDYAGEITVPASDAEWYFVSIKNGRRLLAKVPLVSGVSGAVNFTELALPDDESRLVAESYLSGLQDELVDLVTARTILVARMRAKMMAEDWQAAERIRDQLLRLKPREIFSSELTRQQQRIFCPDPAGQRQIDMMFSEMQRLVQAYLNPSEVEQLVRQLRARQKPTS